MKRGEQLPKSEKDRLVIKYAEEVRNLASYGWLWMARITTWKEAEKLRKHYRGLTGFTDLDCVIIKYKDGNYALVDKYKYRAFLKAALEKLGEAK